jgi:hypothetical protein
MRCVSLVASFGRRTPAIQQRNCDLGRENIRRIDEKARVAGERRSHRARFSVSPHLRHLGSSTPPSVKFSIAAEPCARPKDPRRRGGGNGVVHIGLVALAITCSVAGLRVLKNRGETDGTCWPLISWLDVAEQGRFLGIFICKRHHVSSIFFAKNKRLIRSMIGYDLPISI